MLLAVCLFCYNQSSFHLQLPESQMPSARHENAEPEGLVMGWVEMPTSGRKGYS